MSEPKFTPGPWVADGSEIWGTKSSRINVTSVGTPMIARVCKHELNEHPFPYEANAHLIAAAPELYEILQWALDDVYSDNPGDDWTEDARTALAKARGEA